jgi:hypothetical protein
MLSPQAPRRGHKTDKSETTRARGSCSSPPEAFGVSPAYTPLSFRRWATTCGCSVHAASTAWTSLAFVPVAVKQCDCVDAAADERLKRDRLQRHQQPKWSGSKLSSGNPRSRPCVEAAGDPERISGRGSVQELRWNRSLHALGESRDCRSNACVAARAVPYGCGECLTGEDLPRSDRPLGTRALRRS